MRWFEWLCLLGILVGMLLLWWLRDPSWPQDVEPLERQLERIEERLDRLLEHDERFPRASPATPKPKPRPPRRREPSMFTPLEARLPDLPRVDETLTVPEEPPPRRCCLWTWEAIDAARAVRDLVDGD